jgi:hypothetical protein
MTKVDAMTDLELDATLSRLYREHAKAGPQRRGVLHVLVMLVLNEQARRLDEWLGERQVKVTVS